MRTGSEGREAWAADGSAVQAELVLPTVLPTLHVCLICQTATDGEHERSPLSTWTQDAYRLSHGLCAEATCRAAYRALYC